MTVPSGTYLGVYSLFWRRSESRILPRMINLDSGLRRDDGCFGVKQVPFLTDPIGMPASVSAVALVAGGVGQLQRCLELVSATAFCRQERRS